MGLGSSLEGPRLIGGPPVSWLLSSTTLVEFPNNEVVRMDLQAVATGIASTGPAMSFPEMRSASWRTLLAYCDASGPALN